MRSTSQEYTSPTRILFGCGYLGLRVARLWLRQNDHVISYARGDNRGSELGSEGLWTAQGDVTKPDTLGSLADLPSLGGAPPESLLYAVGFDRTAGPDIHTVYAGGLQNVLTALPPSVNRVVYISTTGVYGPAGGDWVDEQTPPDPQREGGKASLAAEEVLRRHPLGRRSVILRLAGIYGPGRVPYIDKLRAGEPLAVPSSGWLNLIHVDDAARIVVAADQWAAAQANHDGPHVFCVSDGAPAVRADYYAEVARLIGTAPPSFCQPPADSPAAARAESNRRISNQKLIHALNVGFQYPTYREGLAAILTQPPHS